MSKLSIYENSWLDLVFEGRNKEYGAYQLRQQNPQTTLKALFFGTLICGLLVSIPIISNFLKDEEVAVSPPTLPPGTIIYIEKIHPLLPEKKVEPAAKPEKSSAVQKKFVTPTVTNNQTTTTELPALNPEIPIKTGKTDNAGDNDGNVALGSNISTDGTGSKPSEPAVNTGNGTEILPNAGLERSPEFPGGIKKFLELVGNKFRTPEDIEAGGTMKVFVYFVVERDGSLTNIQVLRDPGYGLGNEAIRVLKSIKTKWQAGIQNGKPVRVAYNLPISVNIKN
ncbi:energy transducer TonB [uncultured Flavobacterium sp.]|uniref:energy transducer TonB n=1 Tax=uncultured Flavobacterium sp. TaxID=165435 RepID=UPI0025FC6D44|nr:energy transducer TonB [uncultured Flavobacterium sp.]